MSETSGRESVWEGRMEIREARVAACAFSAAIEIAKEFFDGRDERVARVVPDHTDRARYHDALRLDWSEHRFLAPATFEGYLTVRPASGSVEVILEGAFAGDGSVCELLAELVGYLEYQWTDFVRATPSIEMCNAR